MLRLVLKDMLVQKKSIAFSVLYVVFIIFAFQSMGSAALPTGATAAAYMLLMTACAYEDKNKCDVMINSLPISRKSIVLAKYISVYAYALISTVSYFLATKVLMALQTPINIYPPSLNSIVGALAAIGITSSLFLPIFFKFGYIKSKIFNFLVFLLIFGGAGALGAYMKDFNPQWIEGVGRVLNNQPEGVIAALIIAVILVIQFISYSISVAFYNNREF